MPKEEPEWFVQRTFVGRRVVDASYWPNIAGSVFHEFHNYGKGSITVEGYCEGHGMSDEKPISFKELDQKERDLLRLSTKEFKKKYPKYDVLDTHKTTKQVEEESRREKIREMVSLSQPDTL